MPSPQAFAVEWEYYVIVDGYRWIDNTDIDGWITLYLNLVKHINVF